MSLVRIGVSRSLRFRGPLLHTSTTRQHSSSPAVLPTVLADTAVPLSQTPALGALQEHAARVPADGSAIVWEYVLQGSALWPSNILERVIELCHIATGLPWTMSIVVFTIGMRAALFPLSVMQTRSAIMAGNLKSEVQKMQQDAQELRERGRVEEGHAKIRELSAFMSQNGINPVRLLGFSLLPLPVFMATFFALRNMAKQPVTSFLDGGMLWFTNLVVPDPLYILPALATGTLLLSMEFAKHSNPSQNMSVGMQAGMRILATASFPIMVFMPSALLVYFLTSNIITAATHLMWRSRALKALFNIPEVRHTHAATKPVSFMETFRASYQAHLRDAHKADPAKMQSEPIKVHPQKPKF